MDLVFFIIHGIGYYDEDEQSFKSQLTATLKSGIFGHYWDQPTINFEVIVIKWKEAVSEYMAIHQRLHTSTSEMRKTIHNYAGDVIFYMTPHIADKINNTVISKFNAAVENLRSDPRTAKAKIGVFGHSLGSVIAFDIFTSNQIRPDRGANEKTSPPIPYGSIDALFLLGSPLGGFLTLHSGLPSWFLPPFPVLNIFHPEDPVAFRLEPIFRPQLLEKSLFPSPVPAPRATDMTRKNAIDRYLAKLSSQIGNRGTAGAGIKTSFIGLRGMLESASQRFLGAPSKNSSAISVLDGSNSLPQSVLNAAELCEDDGDDSAVSPSKQPSASSRLFGKMLGSMAEKLGEMEIKERAKETSELSALQVDIDRQAMYGLDDDDFDFYAPNSEDMASRLKNSDARNKKEKELIPNGWYGRLDFSIKDKGGFSSLLPQMQALYAHNSYLSHSDVGLLALNVLMPLELKNMSLPIYGLPWSEAVLTIKDEKKRNRL